MQSIAPVQSLCRMAQHASDDMHKRLCSSIANLRVCVTATCMHRLKLPMPTQSTADHGRAKAILCPSLLSLTPPAPNGTGWHCEVSCVHWPWVTGNK